MYHAFVCLVISVVTSLSQVAYSLFLNEHAIPPAVSAAPPLVQPGPSRGSSSCTSTGSLGVKVASYVSLSSLPLYPHLIPKHLFTPTPKHACTSKVCSLEAIHASIGVTYKHHCVLTSIECVFCRVRPMYHWFIWPCMCLLLSPYCVD